MTEKEMLGTLQLVFDNMGLQMQDREVCGEMLVLLDNMYHYLHDDLQCPYPVHEHKINKGGVFDF